MVIGNGEIRKIGRKRPGAEPRAAGIARGGRHGYIRVMPDAGLSLPFWILFGINTILLLLVWLGQIGLAARLRRISRDLKSLLPEPSPAGFPKESGPSEFERWLVDDPARRALPKKEQFAAYRRWRSERGLTWNSSPGPE